jgi:hypothetical protein
MWRGYVMPGRPASPTMGTDRPPAGTEVSVVSLRVIGAGLPRTATRSLKAALEVLLGGRCYHMEDVFEHLHHVPFWRAALEGRPADWGNVLDGYVAAVDWPASAFWRELSTVHPDALVVLSTRGEPRSWWRSADRTILPGARVAQPPDLREWQRMFNDLLERRFTPHWSDEDAANDAYERHNERVRATVTTGRLLEWQAADGWVRLCRALGVAVPDEPFPHFRGVHPRVDTALVDGMAPD